MLCTCFMFLCCGTFDTYEDIVIVLKMYENCMTFYEYHLNIELKSVLCVCDVCVHARVCEIFMLSHEIEEHRKIEKRRLTLD